VEGRRRADAEVARDAGVDLRGARGRAMLTSVGKRGVRNVHWIDLAGQRFGRWTVLRADPQIGLPQAKWVCRCDCGTERSVTGTRLRRGLSTACGCSRRERVAQMMSDARGTKNRAWRGAEASYFALHRRVYVVRGQPQRCDECGSTDPARTYEWASLTQRYEDVNDYRRMCRSCHRKFDDTIRFVRDRRSSQVLK
jgi:hypothetical protein